MPVTREMPQYMSHKKVWALKIKEILHEEDPVALLNGGDRWNVFIVPEEEGYDKFKVTAAYVDKHKPQVGGYFVQYKDGYQSWSPADAFEEGYTKVE